jgi:CRP-like cAMP-binding protein
MSEGQMRLTRAGHPDWVYRGRWVVGTSDVLIGRPHARTATMETPARLFRLPGERWFEVMERRPEVLLNVIVGFARGVVGLHTRLAPDGAFGAAPSRGSVDVATLAGRAALLAQLALFRGVPMQTLVELADLAERRELVPGQALFDAGRSPGRIFVVARGRVEAFRAAPEVRASFGPGTLVGGAVCLGDEEAAWTAAALDHSEVLSFTAADLFDHVEEHHDGLRALMGALACERERLCDELAARHGELVLE